MRLIPVLLVFSLLPAGAAELATASGDWQRYRDFYLGDGREHLLRFCAFWRDANAQGLSLWQPGLARRLNAPLARDGFSDAQIDALTAGQVVAMSQVCPGIR